MRSDVARAKKASIERCIAQVRLYYAGTTAEEFPEDFLRQDAICLNLQRACEQAIDLGAHLVKHRKLGLPLESKHIFTLLFEARIIPQHVMQCMHGMVGFRNLLVHQYEKVDPEKVLEIIRTRLGDLAEFAALAEAATSEASGPADPD